MRLGAAVLCAVLGASSLLPAEDVGTPEAVLAEGIALVQQGDFEAAVLKLDEASRRLAADPSIRASRPPAAGLTRPLADAYLYLGISYLELNQELNARAKFREVLKVEPTRKLSDRVFSPQIIRVFEAARVEMFPNEKKKRNVLPFLLIAGGGAASAGVAVAASGGDDPPPTQPATTTSTTAPGTGGGNPTTTTTTTVVTDPGSNPTTTTTTLPGASTTTTLPGSTTTTTPTTTLPGSTTTTSSTTTTTTSTTTTTTTSTTLPTCTYSLDPPTEQASMLGDSGTCRVTTNLPGCPWTAQSDASWLVLGGQTSGPGNGNINWSAGLTLLARTGTITLGGTSAPTSARCVIAQSGVGLRTQPQPQGAPETLLRSHLALPGARGQLVANGTTASFQDTGESSIIARAEAGSNRVVAEVISAVGRAGTWRFDLAVPVVAGSLRPLAGTPTELTATSVTFRLTGKPGERVVFTFEAIP